MRIRNIAGYEVNRNKRFAQWAVAPIQPADDSLMEGISLFMEENCEAESLEETREIR